MSLKVNQESTLRLYEQLVERGLKNKKDNSFAILTVQLFGATYLTWINAQLKLNRDMFSSIGEQHLRFREIQNCLLKGEKITGKYFDAWRKNPLFTTDREEQLISKEITLSFAILSLPFQETFRSEKKNAPLISHFENIQMHGTKLLYAFFSKKPPRKFESSDLYCLHRVVFFHFGLFENGSFIPWPTLLFQWAKGITRQIRDFFSLFKQAIPNIESLSKDTPPGPEIEAENFAEYVQERTVRSLESIYGFRFCENWRESLKDAFKKEQTRLDLLFFAGIQKDELQNLPDLGLRSSRNYVEQLKCYSQFLRCYHVRQEDRSLLMELVSVTNFSLLDSYQKYFPIDSKRQEIHEILEWIRQHKKEENGIYLLAYFTKFSAEFSAVKSLSLSFPSFSSVQIIAFLATNADVRVDRIEKFDESWQELNEISNFNRDQLIYLFALKDEPHFISGVELLKKIKALIGTPLESAEVFNFLICQINLQPIQNKIDSLLESFRQITDLEEIKSNILAVANLFGNICNTKDSMDFPLFVGKLLRMKFFPSNRWVAEIPENEMDELIAREDEGFNIEIPQSNEM